MQLVVVSLISCTFFISFQASFAPLRLLDKFGIGKCFLFLLFSFFLRFQEILLLILLCAVYKDRARYLDLKDIAVLRGFVPYVAVEILEVVQVLRILKLSNIVDA